MRFEPEFLSQHTFGIVDPNGAEFLPDGISVMPLAPPQLVLSAHLMPSVVDLRALASEHLAALAECISIACQRQELPPVALLVNADVESDAFARHWNRMQLPRLHTEGRLWLRLHDPRVIHQLLRMLTRAQRKKLFGRATTFTYWIGHEWTSAAREGEGGPEEHQGVQVGVPPYAGPEAWDWSRIVRIGLINRSLQLAGLRDPTDTARKGAEVEELIARAQLRHGLSDDADLIEFAYRALSINAAFDEHRLVAPLLTPSDVNDESSLADRLGRLDARDWESVRDRHLITEHP
jgi:hypothetical protein